MWYLFRINIGSISRDSGPVGLYWSLVSETLNSLSLWSAIWSGNCRFRCGAEHLWFTWHDLLSCSLEKQLCVQAIQYREEMQEGRNLSSYQTIHLIPSLSESLESTHLWFLYSLELCLVFACLSSVIFFYLNVCITLLVYKRQIPFI